MAAPPGHPRRRRVVCVDGPAVGAELTVPADATAVDVHHPEAGVLRYEVTGELSAFPGGMYAARFRGDGVSWREPR